MPPDELKKHIDEWFDFYVSDIADLSYITDMDEFERTMRGVFIKKYGTDKENLDFINEGEFSIQKLLCRFTGADEKYLTTSILRAESL